MTDNWTEFATAQGQLGQVAVKSHSGDKRSTTMRLPIFLGRDATCDIVINSNAFGPISHVIYSPNGMSLSLRNLGSGTDEDIDSLKSLGIQLSPLIATNSELNSRRVLKARLAAGEKRLSHRIPGFKKLALPYRMAIYAAGLLAAGLTYTSLHPQPNPGASDRSQKPIALNYGEVFSYAIDSAADYRVYQHGARFVLMQKEVTRNASRLSFDIQDLNELDEFDIWFNKHRVATLSYDANCITNFCKLSFLLPQDWWQKGENSLVFKHHHTDSNYAIKEILVQTVTKASDLDRLRASDRLAAAERLYEERSITSKNLLTAQLEAKKIVDFSSTFTDLDTIKDRALILQESIVKELTAAREQLSFEVERQISLGQVPQAIVRLNELKELYGPSEQAMRLEIDQRIENLNRRNI